MWPLLFPSSTADVTQLGSSRENYHMMCKPFKFNVGCCCPKFHHLPHTECLHTHRSTSLWFSPMFLASPPQPHSSRLLHFFLQDLYSLLEIPVNYSCFCIMQNDLTFFLVYTSPNSSILRSEPYLSQPSRDDRWMNEFKFNEMPDRQLKTWLLTTQRRHQLVQQSG